MAIIFIAGIGGYVVFMSLVQRSLVETYALRGVDARMDTLHVLLERGRRLAVSASSAERDDLRETIEQALPQIERDALATLAEARLLHPTQIEQQRGRYAALTDAAQELIALPDSELSADHPVYIRMMMSGADILQTEDMTLALLIEARQRQLQAFTQLATVLLILVLGSLLTLYWFMFRPMAKRVEEKERQLRAEIAIRVQTEQHLRSGERLYKLLVDHLPKSAVLLFDRELRHTLTEGPALRELGFPRERFNGKTLDEALPPDYVQVIRPHYEQALAGRASEMEGSTNGRLFHAQYLPLRDPADQIIGGLALIRDVSDEKVAAANQIALTIERERNKLLTEFVRDICHDFRTPLSVMSTNIFLLHRDADDSKRQKRLDTMQLQIDRLSRLLDQLVTIATLEMSTDMPRQKADPKSLLRIIADHYRPIAEAAGLRFTTSVDERLPIIDMNVSQIHSALANVIENALNFTPPGGAIGLEARVDEHDRLVITITDTGCGIPEKDIPHVFDAFYRGDKARGTDSGGAGLGLTIARRIVKLHSGDISISSRLNQGTRVSLWLPLGARKVRTQTVAATTR